MPDVYCTVYTHRSLTYVDIYIYCLFYNWVWIPLSFPVRPSDVLHHHQLDTSYNDGVMRAAPFLAMCSSQRQLRVSVSADGAGCWQISTALAKGLSLNHCDTPPWLIFFFTHNNGKKNCIQKTRNFQLLLNLNNNNLLHLVQILQWLKKPTPLRQILQW